MTTVTAFLESTASLIAAVGALLTGIAAVISAAGQGRHARSRGKEEKMNSTSQFKRTTKTTAVIGVFLILCSLGLFAGRAFSTDKNALNVELTTAAFDALAKDDFLRASANADKCIREFRGAADREQEKLEKAKAPAPRTGKVSEGERQTILSRGLLNDVATCFFIKGKAFEGLGRRAEAINAYREAARYTYARCWDPKGWFWSPSEAAQDRLATLEQKSS